MTLMSLPSHLIQEILSRLPLKALFACKLVCKQLMALLKPSDPEFAQLHLSKSRLHLLYRFPDRSLSLFDLRGHGEALELRAHSFWYGYPLISLVNSCKGLLCLATRDRVSRIAVCNPILGELITLPQLSDCFEETLIAIGFSDKEKRFKVLAVVGHRTQDINNLYWYEARIYDIGGATPSWRSVGPAPCDFYDIVTRSSIHKHLYTYMNGAVHWLNDWVWGSPLLHAFDFNAEQFQLLPLSDQMDVHPDVRGLEAGIFKECLAVYNLSRGSTGQLLANVWIMKEYGVKESWARVYSVQLDEDSFPPTPKPVMEFLGGREEAWLMFHLWSMRDEVYDSICLKAVPHVQPLQSLRRSVVGLTPSFFSLRLIANQEVVELLN